MKITIFLTVLSFLVFGKEKALSQATNANSTTGASTGLIKAEKILSLADIEFVESDCDVVQRELRGKMEKLMNDKNFESLDKMADDLRTSKAQTADGIWHLSNFYVVLCELPKTSKDIDWKIRIEFLNKWISAQPESITARVALARCHTYYAWFVRGTGYGYTVTDTMGKLFQERLSQAHKILIEAKTLKTKCPVWSHTMQRVAIGQGWDRAAYENVFSGAMDCDPSFSWFYFTKAIYLLPRWYGKEGDWQKFASEAADRLGGEAGDMLYARIGWQIHRQGMYGGFLQDAGYSWPRLKKGMEAIITKYPHSNGAANELGYFLFQKQENKEFAKTLYQRIGSNADQSIWRDGARFLRARTWAFSE